MIPLIVFIFLNTLVSTSVESSGKLLSSRCLKYMDYRCNFLTDLRKVPHYVESFWVKESRPLPSEFSHGWAATSWYRMCTLAAGVVVFPAVVMIWVQWAACTALLTFFHMFCNELNLMTQAKLAIFPTQPVLCAELLGKDCFSGYRDRQE